MKVLVVTNLYFTGRGIWVADQVRTLRSLGLDIDVISFDTKETRLHYGLRLPDLIRALRSRKYDVIHTHHTYTVIMVKIAKASLRLRTPVVFTNHEPEILDRQGRTRTWHPMSRLRHSLWLKRFAAHLADFVIFVTHLQAEALGWSGSQAFIPSPVDLQEFKPMDRSECRRRLGIPENRTVIFFPGNPVVRRKRFSLAQAAWEVVRVQDPGCLLVTGGGIPHAEMPVYYNAADAVLQTTLSEASNTSVKEALACEIPVVSTDAGDTREVLAGVPYCAICSEDPADLAGRLLEARGHRALGGRDQVLRRRASAEQVARDILNVYERVLGSF